MTINLTAPTKDNDLKPRIVVIGVGGAGGNAVNNMIRSKLEGVEFVVANTDAQALCQSLADRRVQLGLNTTRGLGAGSRPEVGRAAAEETMEQIRQYLEGSNMVFIAAGMGGGTGTGAAPIIAQAARDLGMLTVGVVTKPFHFEGQHRMRIAESGIETLQAVVDTLIIIPNQNLFRVANERTTFADAFKMADDVLHSGVRGVTDLMVMPGLINLDFADIRTVMSEMGKAMMGTGEAEGDNRAVDAAQKAISNPLLDDVSMKGARGVLINITGGPDMTLFEVDEAANKIRDEVDPEANIIFGSTFDESLEGRMRVSVVATGIDVAAGAVRLPYAGMTLPPRAVSRPAGQPVQPAIRVPAAIGTPTAPAPAALEAPPAAAQPAPLAAAPVAASPEPATAPVASPQPAPARRVTNDMPFLAPRPVEPATVDRIAQPDPFNAAALTNKPREPARERKSGGPSLLEIVTGTGRGRRPAEPREKPAAPAASPASQPRLSGLDPTERPAPSRTEDDLLDIPAFLRRQAN